MYLFFYPSPTSLGSLSLNPPASQTPWNSYMKIAGKPYHLTNYHLTLTFLTKVNTTSPCAQFVDLSVWNGPGSIPGFLL